MSVPAATLEHMFELHGEVIELPAELDIGLVLKAPLRDAAGLVDVRATLDALVDEPPGPWMHNIAVLIASLDERDLTPDERIDLLAVFERCDAWLSAQKQRVLAGIRRDAGDKPMRSREDNERFEDTRMELALAMGWSEQFAWERMQVARELDERLPRTWRALAEGQISYAKAREIALGSQQLSDDRMAAALEDRVLVTAGEQMLSDLRRAVNRHVMRLDPEGAEGRRQQTRRERRVTRRACGDGGAHLGVNGPAEAIAVIHNALSVGARQLTDTGQVDSLDQGRFDTLLDWAIRTSTSAPCPVGRRCRSAPP